MDAATASILISCLALVVSVLAVVYTRRQAQAAESHLAHARAVDTERRLREGLAVSIHADDPVRMVVTVKSFLPDPIADLTLTTLPESDEPVAGFWADTSTRLVSVWPVGTLAPGEEAAHPMSDLRKGRTTTLDVRIQAHVDGRPYAWTVAAPITYTPKVRGF